MSLYVKYVSAPKLTQEKMSVASDDGQLGDPVRLAEGFPDTPWATLETQGWPLDGTRDILPDKPSDIGWWSKKTSNEDGLFFDDKIGAMSNPVLRIVFPKEKSFSAPGLSVRFWPATGEWCNNIYVTWYLNDVVVDSTEAFPDSANWSLDYSVEEFNRIDIEFMRTNIPHHFAKLQQITIGRVEVFDQDELVRVSLLNETDPSACELSADELTVEIRENKKHEMNIQKNHRLQLYRNGEIIASHYIQEYTREGENKFTLKCNSAISQLGDTFIGDFYDNEPLDRILSEVFGEIDYEVDDSFLEKKISGYLPICTKREALQQIAFAIGAYVTTQGDGTIRLKPVLDPLASKPVSGFGKDKILSGSNLRQVKPPKEIQVVSHKYIYAQESEVLAEVSIPDDKDSVELIYTFSDPHKGYDYSADNEWTHVHIWEQHAHWVRLDATGGSEFKLIGKKCVDQTAAHTWSDPHMNPKFDWGSEAVKVENATLITEENVQEAIARLRNYHSLASSLNGTVVADGQKAGEVVEIANPFGTNLTVGYITKMESEFTANGHTASIEVRGAERVANDAEVLKV